MLADWAPRREHDRAIHPGAKALRSSINSPDTKSWLSKNQPASILQLSQHWRTDAPQRLIRHTARRALVRAAPSRVSESPVHGRDQLSHPPKSGLPSGATVVAGDGLRRFNDGTPDLVNHLVETCLTTTPVTPPARNVRKCRDESVSDTSCGRLLAQFNLASRLE